MNNKTIVAIVKYWLALVIGIAIAASFVHVPLQRLQDIIMGATLALLLISPKWDKLWPEDKA